MQTGMNEKNRQRISDHLARVLADSYGLYLKTQHFHWNVEGPEFYQLHILFEKQYLEMAEAIDEIAERIRALGFYVEASFSAFQRLTSIREDNKVIRAPEMLQQLAQGHETLILLMRELSVLAEEDNDGATVDLLGRRLGAHEKMLWMLRSSV